MPRISDEIEACRPQRRVRGRGKFVVMFHVEQVPTQSSCLGFGRGAGAMARGCKAKAPQSPEPADNGEPPERCFRAARIGLRGSAMTAPEMWSASPQQAK